MSWSVGFACKVCHADLWELVATEDTPTAREVAREMLMARFEKHLNENPACLDAYEKQLGLDPAGPS